MFPHSKIPFVARGVTVAVDGFGPNFQISIWRYPANHGAKFCGTAVDLCQKHALKRGLLFGTRDEVAILDEAQSRTVNAGFHRQFALAPVGEHSQLSKFVAFQKSPPNGSVDELN
jgi:hypothetical protein